LRYGANNRPGDQVLKLEARREGGRFCVEQCIGGLEMNKSDLFSAYRFVRIGLGTLQWNMQKCAFFPKNRH